MRRHPKARDLLHLEFDVGVEVGVGEDAGLGQERTIAVEVVERLIQTRADGRDLRVFLGRQVVEVLARGLARVDLVLDAVEPRHQQRAESEIGVGIRHFWRQRGIAATTGVASPH